MGAKRLIKNCNFTHEVADLLARTIRKMVENNMIDEYRMLKVFKI